MDLQKSIFAIIPACLILLLCSPVKLDDSVTHMDNVPSLNPVDISHGLPDVIVFVGRLFEYSLASHEIFGQDNVKLKVREVDKDGLPDWIQYNATAHALLGIPTSHDTGNTYIEVTRLCNEIESCQAISDVFRLIVKYSSLGATGTSAPLLSKHAISGSVDTKNMANIPSLSSVDEHGCGEEIVLASLVLCVSVDSLNMQQKMTMLNNMADFLSVPVWRLTVMQTSGQKLRAVERGYQILSAGPAPEGLCDLDKTMELSWRLSCSTVKHIKDFVKVLQHNLNVGRVGKEVGQPVVGWYVASSDSLETAKKRRRRQIPHRTPIPTPVLQPVTPTVVDETVRVSPVITSTPSLPEASEYVPQIMTRQPVIVDEDTPVIASSPHPEERPKSWQVVVDEITPSIYPTSSKVMLKSSHYTGMDVESFGTSGETDTLESSYTRVIPTTSRATMIPRVTEHYVPDVFDTSFSGSGSSYVDIWPSVIDTSPITRTYDLPDYASSSFVAVEATPVVEFFHTTAAAPEAWPEPVVPSSTSQEQRILERMTTEVFRQEKTEPTVTRRVQESTTITPEMTDMDFLIPHKPSSTRVYQSPSEHVLLSSESSGDTVVFVIPEHRMPASSPIHMSSMVYRSQVFVPSRSEMISSVASGEEESSSSFVSLMSSAVYIPIGSGSGSGSGSGDGMVKESVAPSKSYPTEKLPTSTEGIEISGSGQMGSGDNVSHPVDHTTPGITEINHPPMVVIPISERLIVPLGIFWEFKIPSDVFFDEEDGDVTNLELSLTFMDGRRVPPEYWLQVDKNRRTLTGLLTISDIDLEHQQVLLVGTDSGGLSAYTIIHLELETPSNIMQTHKFDIAFSVYYDEFMSNKKTNLDRLLGRISSYYGDGDSSNIRVTDLRRGSLVLSWNNATLNGMVCDSKTIRRLFTRMMRRGETLRSNFIKHMQPEFHPLFVEYELLGACNVASSGQVTPLDSDSYLQTNIPVHVDYTEPLIYPSSASGEGSALDKTDRLHSPVGSGLFTERVEVMPVVTESVSVFGSGGLWTAVVHPKQSSSISPTITEAMVASSVFVHHQLPPHLRPDFVTDPTDTTTESSTYTESSTSSSTTAMTTTSAGMTVVTGRQKTDTTSSWEDKTLPWVSSVESWTFPVRSTEGVDRAPFLEDPIDYIPANLGKYFEYEIPRGTFYDREDGDTRALQLSLTLLNGQTLPIDFWLQLNTEKQVITGLPLLVDLDVGYHRITLVATDSHGQSVKDAIKLYVNSSSFVRFTHKFVMTFKIDFAAFMNDRTNLNKLLQRISSYFGDTSADNMVVMDVSMGSLVLSWSNTTLNGDVCYNKTIGKIFKRMVRKGEMVRPSFLRHLSPEYELSDVTYELQGACVYTPTTEHIPTTEASTSGSGLSIWAQVVLPVMIALLVLLLVLLIILLINRKRKRQSALQNSEKPVFTNDRNPIIFPEEMEGDEMGLKPKKPIVLPNDRNQSATPSPRTTYYFEDDPQSDHGSNYGTGSRTGSGRRHPKSPPPYYQPHSDPPPYRLPPPYLNNSSDV